MVETGVEAEVLNYLKCAEMPDPLKEGEIFVRAIAKVRKVNGHESYCLVVNNGTNKPLVKKVFGTIRPIKEILEIYPLSVLDTESVPDLRKKKELVLFLVQCGERQKTVEALVSSKEDADKETLKALIIKHCVKQQLYREKNAVVAAQENKMTENEEVESEDSTDSTTDNENDTNQTTDNENGTDENNDGGSDEQKELTEEPTGED